MDGEGAMMPGSSCGFYGEIAAERTSGRDAMSDGRHADCMCLADLAEMARPLIRRYGLQAEVGAEDVANTALFLLCKAVSARKAPDLDSNDIRCQLMFSEGRIIH